MAYDNTRVRLVPREGMISDDYDAYINANFVDGPLLAGDKKIIASQGPKKNTCPDFWRMVS